ncbi:MAG: transcriptional repressor [Pirellulales bacterium]
MRRAARLRTWTLPKRWETKGFEKSTLFRALSDLAEAHMARKLDLGDHVWRFELVRSEKDGHPHMLCVDCEVCSVLNDGQVELKTSRTLGTIENVLLKGIARTAAKKRSASAVLFALPGLAYN